VGFLHDRNASTVAALNIALQFNIYCLCSLSVSFWRVHYVGAMNKKRPHAIKGTKNHAKRSFSTEIFADATISVVQYLARLRYVGANLSEVYDQVEHALQKPRGLPSAQMTHVLGYLFHDLESLGR
jgi:hypothetical protein